MENAKEQIEELIKIGEEFAKNNFAHLNESNGIITTKPEWRGWLSRCEKIIIRLYGEKSSMYTQIKSSTKLSLMNQPLIKFPIKQAGIIKTLGMALETLEKDMFDELLNVDAKASGTYSNKVFVVHGHDEKAKTDLEMLLTEFGLKPIVLHRQADEGKTIIEKFEKHSDVGYVFVLLTPDERAYLTKEEDLPNEQKNTEYRARPNVIFEFGYFVGKLGRERVCCLHTGGVSLPSDVSGVIYKSYTNNVEDVGISIRRDLKAAGYTLS